MKISVSVRRIAAFILLFAVMSALALPVFAEIEYPTPTDYIADDAAVLSEQTVKQIKEKNADLASEIKAVIAVCTVKSTNGIEIGKYARSLYSEWKLPTGILIVVASEDKSFFLVPSTGVSEVIDNTALEEVRDQYIEDDFAAGRIDTAIRKAVTQLSILMLREMKQETAPAQSGDAPAQTPAATDAANARGDAEEKGTSLGGIIVGILKTILIIALILLALFVILFIAALFNDDVAAIMQKYIFRRGRTAQNNNAYYDDRLYGQQGQNRSAQNRRPNYNGQGYSGQGYNNQQNRAPRPVRYDANGNPIRTQRPRPQQGQTYYNADGTPRQTARPQNPNAQYPQQGTQQNYYQANAQRARQQQNQANAQNRQPQQPQASADATRAYTIPGRGHNAR